MHGRTGSIIAFTEQEIVGHQSSFLNEWFGHKDPLKVKCKTMKGFDHLNKTLVPGYESPRISQGCIKWVVQNLTSLHVLSIWPLPSYIFSINRYVLNCKRGTKT